MTFLQDIYALATSSTLNIILTFIVIYMITTSILKQRNVSTNPTNPNNATSSTKTQQKLEYRKYTPLELSKFDGNHDPNGSILLAARRKVYDVTQGKAFYGPKGPYKNFAGRDASRGFANHSFDSSMISPVAGPIDKLDDLTKEQENALDSWINHMKKKYPVVGELVENPGV